MIVALSAASGLATTVTYSVGGGTAIVNNGSNDPYDYTLGSVATTGTVQIAAYATEFSIPLEIYPET